MKSILLFLVALALSATRAGTPPATSTPEVAVRAMPPAATRLKRSWRSTTGGAARTGSRASLPRRNSSATATSMSARSRRIPSDSWSSCSRSRQAKRSRSTTGSPGVHRARRPTSRPSTRCRTDASSTLPTSSGFHRRPCDERRHPGIRARLRGGRNPATARPGGCARGAAPRRHRLPAGQHRARGRLRRRRADRGVGAQQSTGPLRRCGRFCRVDCRDPATAGHIRLRQRSCDAGGHPRAADGRGQLRPCIRLLRARAPARSLARSGGAQARAATGARSP